MKHFHIPTLALAIGMTVLAFFIVVLFMVGAIPRHPTIFKNVELTFEGNGTATRTLSMGEESGGAGVIAIIPYSSVVLSWPEPISPVGDARYRTLILTKGMVVENCGVKATLIEVNATSATFEYRLGRGCPICIYQGILVQMTPTELQEYVVR